MKFARIGFLLSLVLALTNIAVANERIGDFALLDDQGRFHQLSYYGDYQAVAVLVSGLSSQADKEQLSAFAELAATRSDDVVFWVLNPNPEMDREAVRAALDSQQIDLPVLMDESQLVAKSLSARTFGEVFVLNPQAATLVQRTSTEPSIAVEDVETSSTFMSWSWVVHEDAARKRGTRRQASGGWYVAERSVEPFGPGRYL